MNTYFFTKAISGTHDFFIHLYQTQAFFTSYPPVNKHSNGKSPSRIENTSSNGGFFIALLDYRRVSQQKTAPQHPKEMHDSQHPYRHDRRENTTVAGVPEDCPSPAGNSTSMWPGGGMWPSFREVFLGSCGKKQQSSITQTIHENWYIWYIYHYLPRCLCFIFIYFM